MTTFASTLDLVGPIDPLRSAALYASRPVAIATRHGKAEVLADVLALSGLFLVPVAVDTDALGTFTGEVPRALDLFATATAKSRLGAGVSGLALNIASEGSFGVDPATGMIRVQREVVALVDTETGLVVHGRAARPAPWVRSWEIDADDDVTALVADLDLRSHRLTVRPATEITDAALVTKEIADLDTLRRAVGRASTADGGVVVETDLRAHVCPDRHPVMREAAADLLVRLATRCPLCTSPGFGPEEDVPGLPCGACGTPTDDVAAVVHRCPACEFTQRVDALVPTAEPAVCPSCNP